MTSLDNLINVHSPSQCQGRYCCVHNPSDHSLNYAPLNYRLDKYIPIMERICEHGVGHPDPDDYEYLKSIYPNEDLSYTQVHGCCGCCSQ